MYKKLLIFAILALTYASSFTAKAQDPHFSQFYANPLFLNPALTGGVDCGRLNLNYRNQWPSAGNAYVTYSASYDQSVPFISSGIGLSFVADKLGEGGALSRNYISGFYSYHLQVTENLLINAGFQGSYLQESLDWSQLIFADQIDPSTGNISIGSMETPPSNLDKSIVDFSAGLMAGYLDRFFAGVAVHHLTEPANGFYDAAESYLAMRITVHGGTNINLSTGKLGGGSQEEYLLSPNILYMQQAEFKELNVGGYLTRYPFVGGVWYRHAFENPDAAVFLIGIQQDRYKIGYSYDFNVSALSSISGGAHEISFAWRFCVYSGEKRRRIKAIKSPTF